LSDKSEAALKRFAVPQLGDLWTLDTEPLRYPVSSVVESWNHR